MDDVEIFDGRRWKRANYKLDQVVIDDNGDGDDVGDDNDVGDDDGESPFLTMTMIMLMMTGKGRKEQTKSSTLRR